MAAPERKKHTGIDVRHSTFCASERGGRCSCSPKYRVIVYD